MIPVLLSLAVMVSSGGADAACDSRRVKLQMLGTGGPELFGDRASTGYLIWLDDKARVVVDAGPGSVQRFKASGARFEDVDLMLFTHFHVDHSADFPAYIKGSYFTDRTQDLIVMGPSGNTLLPSATQFVERMLGGKGGVYPYLSDYLEHADPSASYTIRARTVPWSYQSLDIRTIYQAGGVTVKSAPVHHGPLPALAYRLEVAGCVLSFSGDMSGRLGQMPRLARGSDILVAHNAIPEDATGAAANLHMKPGYIGEMAASAGVKHLALSHLMRRTIDRKDETLQQIRRHYSGPVSFPNDLDVIRP
jgi:ribonuclease BN (tRNA processing enzyme)